MQATGLLPSLDDEPYGCLMARMTPKEATAVNVLLGTLQVGPNNHLQRSCGRSKRSPTEPIIVCRQDGMKPRCGNSGPMPFNWRLTKATNRQLNKHQLLLRLIRSASTARPPDIPPANVADPRLCLALTCRVTPWTSHRPNFQPPSSAGSSMSCPGKAGKSAG